MTKKLLSQNRRRIGLRALALAGVALLALAGPLAADTRHCVAELNFAPQNAAQTWLRYNFTVHKTVDGIRYNEAREDARARMIACVRDHWELRDLDHRPDNCVSRFGYDFRGYPFEALGDEITAALCAANPEAQTMLIGVDLNISGERGCAEDGSHIRIAQNAVIDCRAPIGDGGADEAYVPEEEPPAVIPDGGDWDCVGEGCDDTSATDEPATDEPAAEGEALPATATYLPLPNFRLPGNDLYLVELDAPNWLLCRQACTEDPRCGAWTYRGPTAASGPVCLIKSRAGLPVPDACCRSGVKQ